MWVKLGSDYINLDHVYRVRFTKGFHKGEEEWTVEVESIDPRGQTSTLTRYRGAEAMHLQTLLEERCSSATLVIHDEQAAAQTHVERHTVQANVGTLHDIHLP